VHEKQNRALDQTDHGEAHFAIHDTRRQIAFCDSPLGSKTRAQRRTQRVRCIALILSRASASHPAA